ncbi:MAG: succinyl-diaminopimelate desuccinylase [Deltaproteobacteria bacterium]|nr:succinyl-diaminopimelate desuccinylase [Deltaproteobacteria bacterium]
MTLQTTLSQILLELVRIPSETMQEKDISDFIKTRLDKQAGFRLTRDEVGLIFSSDFNTRKKTLAFYGHLDTVKDTQDLSPQIKDQKVFGCGASDMKAGLAVMMKLMMDYKEDACRFNLIFVFYDAEEGPYLENGLGRMLENNPQLKKCDLAFLLEPTSNSLQVGCVGGLHAKVKIHGKSSHSARPWEGKNAVFEGIEILEKLRDFGKREKLIEGLAFYEVMNPTLLQAGKTRNAIPDLFELNVNYRFAPGKSINQAKEEMRLYLGKPDIEFVDECPSADVVVKNDLLREFKELGQFEMKAKQAWTDIARLSAIGIPAVNFGPGDPSQAHQKNEFVLINDLAENYRYFERYLYPSQTGN